MATNIMNTMDRIALILIIVGAINWGLVGVAQVDLVSALFGGQTEIISRIVYALVGLAGLYCVRLLLKPSAPHSVATSKAF
jgi:uncharacterized membrane protein YuzA (DUF378 family)